MFKTNHTHEIGHHFLATGLLISAMATHLLLAIAFGVLTVVAQAVPDFQDAAAAASEPDGAILFNNSLTTDERRDQHNFTDFVRVRDIMNVFGVDHIASVWPQLERQLSGGCSKDLMEYMQGLEAGKLWAMQSMCCEWGDILKISSE